MNLSRALNQTVQWQAITSTDDRDDPTYASAVALVARKQQKIKDLIGKDGEVITATDQIMLGANATVKVGDLLDGREVIGISSMVTFSGSTIGFMVLTR